MSASSPLRQDATAAASAAPSWTAEQAIAALTAEPVVKLPGSPAVIDEQRLTEAIGTSTVKILAVPFAQPEKPTDSRHGRRHQRASWRTVRSWAFDQ